MNLTEKQLRVYLYIKDFIEKQGYSPTYREIQQSFGLKSVRSIQKYIYQIEEKGFIRIGRKGSKRAIVLSDLENGSRRIPFLGTVAAGKPIEAIEESETVEIPGEMIGSGSYFALRVRGFSMVEDGILDNDLIIVKKQLIANNGQTVVALIDGNTTVKKYYYREGIVELRPANPSMSPIFISEGKFEIQGIFVGLLRISR